MKVKLQNYKKASVEIKSQKDQEMKCQRTYAARSDWTTSTSLGTMVTPAKIQYTGLELARYSESNPFLLAAKQIFYHN